MGCGAIGSRIAEAIHRSFHPAAVLAGIYDPDAEKAKRLSQTLHQTLLPKKSLADLLTVSDLIVEAVYAPDTAILLKRILDAHKDLLVMSVGHLLKADDLFQQAAHSGCHILIPSGAIAGIDAIKAASRIGIDTITLTTYKPPTSLQGSPFIIKNKISLNTILKETVLFEGTVDDAIAAFPQNINVAATIALASRAKDKLRIRIITSPEFTYNRHEIHMTGPFGRMTTITENNACPDNPKTSYLAVLSGIEALWSFCQTTKIGT